MKNLCCGNNSKIYVALSGGVDSVVLLHRLSQTHKIQAIHVNHSLQNNSIETMHFCKKLCDSMGIHLTIINLNDLTLIKNNRENSYREARYKAITQNIPDNSTIALAHHSDDQLETRIKRIFTGSFIVNGMENTRNINGINIIRPLINLSKQDILIYAKQNNLDWVEDPSNQDISFERNYIRHKIVPELQQLWPGVKSSLSTLIEKHQLNHKIAQEIAEYDLKTCSSCNQIIINKMLLLSETRQLNCWLAFLAANTIKLEFNQAKSLWQQCQKNQKPVLLARNKIWVQNYGIGLIIKQLPEPRPMTIWHNLEQDLETAIGTLSMQANGTLRKPHLDEVVSIKYREPGMIVKLTNKPHNSKLKKLMQEWQIPNWQRNCWPIIYYNDKMACIPNYAILEGFYNESGINIFLQDKASKPQE